MTTPATTEVLVELADRAGRIEVAFPYNDQLVRKMKAVPGARWQRTSRTWTVPRDMDTCRTLRNAFGAGLVLGPEVKLWARGQVASERNLGSLAMASTAELKLLPGKLPALARAIHLGPRGRFMTAEAQERALADEDASFQAADVAFMAAAEAPANFNQPGMGKTLETIASVYEADMDAGAHLVVAPKTSLETVWEMELLLWTDAYVVAAVGSRAERQAAVEQAMELAAEGKPVWLVVNPDMVAFSKDETHTSTDHVRKAKDSERTVACACDAMKDPHWHYAARYPELFSITWATVTIDEAHKAALGNTNSIRHAALTSLLATKKMLLTATPFGGKIIKLFGLLQFLRPDVFTSKWNWADMWLDVDDNGYGKNLAKAKLKRDKTQEFYRSLVPYVLRRTKAEVLDYLPAKQFVHVWCEMEGKQREQYEQFERDSEVRIEEEHLSATSVLAEYTRLRQMATARHTMDAGKPTPTQDSCKLPHLLQLLDERGLVGEDASGDEQVVIFSQFEQVVEMVAAYLAEQGVAVATLTGQTSQQRRTDLQRAFQADGGLRVLVMTTTAGGVSITLDKASTVVMLDETWNPDDQEQAEDRCHRASRIHQVTIYYLRTKDTIEEYVFDTTTGKSLTNDQVLDVRRRMEDQPHMSTQAA